jgi:maltose alpha-D-glucosyltransferase/alpha-amylase
MADEESATRIVRSLLRRRSAGRIVTERRAPLRAALRTADPERRVRLVGVEQSNTSVVLGDEVMVKLLRRIDRGTNPDVEIGRHLESRAFAHAAPVLGSAAWRRGRGEPDTIAIAYRFVPNEGDAWRHALDHLSRFYDTVLTEPMTPAEPAPDLDLSALDTPTDRRPAHIGSFLDDAVILGQRTGELHAALAGPDVDDFEPEPFTRLYQRSLYQAFRTSIRSTLAALRRSRSRLDEERQAVAARILDSHDRLEAAIAPLRDGSLDATRIRTHGDYHLGQVLVAASDFVVIDFEGEPARPTSERRIKRSPLADVAGMLRSFDYAAHVGLDERADRGLLASTADPTARAWAEWWRREVTRAFLAGYLGVPEARGLLPSDPADLRLLLDGYLLDKALYELRYELANRPAWVGIPLDALDRRVGRVT